MNNWCRKKHKSAKKNGETSTTGIRSNIMLRYLCRNLIDAFW